MYPLYIPTQNERETYMCLHYTKSIQNVKEERETERKDAAGKNEAG